MNPRIQTGARGQPHRHRVAAAASRIPGEPTQRGRLDFSGLTPLHMALGCLVLVSAGQIHRIFGFLAPLRPGIMLVVIASVLALIYPKVLRFGNLTSAWPGLAIATLVATWLGSALLGISISASAAFFVQALLPIIVGFALMLACIRYTTDLVFLSLAYVASCVLVVVASIFMAETIYMTGYTRRGGVGMYDGNDVGVLYMVGIPLALALARSRDLRLRLLGWAGAVGMPLSIVLSASRGAFLGLLSGGVALLIMTPGISKVRKLGAVAFAALALTVFAPSGYWGQMATMLNPQADYNMTEETGRLQIWRNGLGYIQEYPVFGVGPNNFVRAGWELTVAGRTGLVGVARRDQAPHNTFLQVWTELGTIGLVVWLGILVGGVVSTLRLRRRMPRWWLRHGTEEQRLLYLLIAHLPAAFIGFAVTTFFVSHAYTQILYILVAILGGTMLVSRTVLRETAAMRGPVPSPAARFAGIPGGLGTIPAGPRGSPAADSFKGV